MDFSIEKILSSTPIPGFPDLTLSRLLLDLLVFALIYLLAQFSIWSIKNLLKRRFRNIDEGKGYAMKQISTYLIYAIAISLILDKLHIGSIIFTSFAGLFVGLGFGIQQTFNDLASGLILLFEGSVKVGDIIKVEDWVGRVTYIGVRHSQVQTRDDISIMVPNSKLIVQNVVNYSGQTNITRFKITVGVVYGSDIELVKEKLIDAVHKHPRVVQEVPRLLQHEDDLPTEGTWVYFRDFGDNSLIFDIYFWTRHVWDVDIVKSDIRFEIDRLFRQSKIVIAFPQRDVHLKIDDGDLDKFQQLSSK